MPKPSLPLLVLVFVLLACASFDAAAAKATSKAKADEGPQRVTFGVYVLSIYDIDLANDSYGASLFVWWRYAKSKFDPLRDTQFLNARQLRYENITERELEDGTRHVSAMAQAVINKRWDISSYPFDRHQLTLVVETPFPADELILALDQSDSRFAPDALPPGWRMTDFRLVASVEGYDSLFGRPKPDGAGFSRGTIVADIARDNAYALLGRFSGFFAAAVIAMLMYLLKPIDLGPRVGLAVCAVLSAIGNTLVLQPELGHGSGFALPRQIALITFVAIVVAIANAVATARFHQAGRQGVADRINLSAGIASSLLYLGAVAVVLFAAGADGGGTM
jgi:hypothetical protein